MSHEIMNNDTVVSYNNTKMWHNLGNVIEGYVSLDEAWEKSGMDWAVAQFPVQADVYGEIVTLDNRMVNVRIDQKDGEPLIIPLGVVGNDYQVVQNKEHWDDFIVPFAEFSNSRIETTGTLRNGKLIWFLLKMGEVEYIKNDVIDEYFLLSSSHDGTSCTTVMSTPIRVVCNNTLTAAINGAQNAYKVRHHKNHNQKMNEIKNALGMGEAYREKFDEAMQGFVALQMTEGMMRGFLEEKVFPKKEIDPNLLLTLPKAPEKVPVRAETIRQDNIKSVMQLVENGMGADIPGVRGTAYGLYNAVVEYYDHHSRMRRTDNRTEDEIRFESNIWGTSQKAKEKVMGEMLTLL